MVIAINFLSQILGIKPPSTRMVLPVIYAARSLARTAAVSSYFSGLPYRPIGMEAALSACTSEMSRSSRFAFRPS